MNSLEEPNKMTEKQPDWITNCCDEFAKNMSLEIGSSENDMLIYQMVYNLIHKHLPKESTYESGYSEGHKIGTDVGYRECAMDLEKKGLTYESGYQKGREDMKREILESLKTIRKKYYDIEEAGERNIEPGEILDDLYILSPNK